jgi:hypothetical protein
MKLQYFMIVHNSMANSKIYLLKKSKINDFLIFHDFLFDVLNFFQLFCLFEMLIFMLQLAY